MNGHTQDCEVLLYWRRCAKYGDVEAMMKLGFALYEGTSGACEQNIVMAYGMISVYGSWKERVHCTSDVMYMESLEIKLFKTHRQPDTIVTYVVS